VRKSVAVVYNEPFLSRYDAAGEEKAVLGVLEAVEAVNLGLIELDYKVSLVPLAPPIDQALQKLRTLEVDIVFNLFEGFCGSPETEALIPETLDEIGVPYTGCPPRILRLALDKAETKIILMAAGIRTPDSQLLTPDNLDTFHLVYPCMVKPRKDDASHGISSDSMVKDFAALEKQVKALHKTYGGSILVEKFLTGREFNATVMGNSQFRVLPISEIVYDLPPDIPRILTFAAKWEPDSPLFAGTRAVCPAVIEPEVKDRIGEVARAAFRAVGCRGYARVDMRMDEEGQLNVLEVNPNPDISPGTGAARQAAASGLTYSQFCQDIISLALEKDDHDSQNTPDAGQRQTRTDEDIEKYTGVQTV
jgi:D-alanine-D-alanine ligase